MHSFLLCNVVINYLCRGNNCTCTLYPSQLGLSQLVWFLEHVVYKVYPTFEAPIYTLLQQDIYRMVENCGREAQGRGGV